ncbi:MAG TPA: hypothetical protein VFC99_15135 [Acidimicrobiia bacterium]|nr:hypothetical protein [Acidimicrobiia bacterium]
MGTLLRRMSRTGLRRGLMEGSRAWMVVGVGATVLRLAGRALANRPEVVYRTELHPGEGLEIRTFRPGRARGA